MKLVLGEVGVCFSVEGMKPSCWQAARRDPVPTAVVAAAALAAVLLEVVAVLLQVACSNAVVAPSYWQAARRALVPTALDAAAAVVVVVPEIAGCRGSALQVSEETVRRVVAAVLMTLKLGQKETQFGLQHLQVEWAEEPLCRFSSRCCLLELEIPQAALAMAACQGYALAAALP